MSLLSGTFKESTVEEYLLEEELMIKELNLKDTMFLGVGKRAEIWSTQKLEEFNDMQTQDSIMAAMSSGLI